jgi:hypothetical protein
MSGTGEPLSKPTLIRYIAIGLLLCWFGWKGFQVLMHHDGVWTEAVGIFFGMVLADPRTWLLLTVVVVSAFARQKSQSA